MKKKIFYGIVVLIVIIQFFRIDKNNPAVISTEDFIEVEAPPQEIATILKTSCYDCHSNKSTYPWYSNIAPVSWWLKGHIDEAREELNFSKWGTYSEERKEHKLEEMGEELEEEEMPLSSYTWIHGEAKLTKDQRTQLQEWIERVRVSEEVKEYEDEVELDNGRKWNANVEITAGIHRMLAILNQDVDDGRLSYYVAMGEKLNMEVQTIHDECTMKGEAEQMFYRYLQPLEVYCDYLESVKDEQSGLSLQQELLEYIRDYDVFFTSEVD